MHSSTIMSEYSDKCYIQQLLIVTVSIIIVFLKNLSYGESIYITEIS